MGGGGIGIMGPACIIIPGNGVYGEGIIMGMPCSIKHQKQHVTRGSAKAAACCRINV